MRFKNIQFIFKIIFFMMIVAIFYQAGGLYVMKKKVNIEIENTEKEVSEYSEKKKKLQSNIKNFSEEEKNLMVEEYHNAHKRYYKYS